MALAFLIGSFLVWKKTREDYPEDDILSMTVILAVLSLVSFFSWRYISVAGTLLLPGVGMYLWVKKHNWNYWEWMDTVGPVSLVMALLACLSWGPQYLLPSSLFLLGLILVTILGKYYRRFRWYKSGKVGFVGVISIMAWMLAWIGIANWHVSGVYWGGLVLESWVSLWVIIACIVTLYVRGGRRVTHDWRSISKIWQPKKPK